MNELQLIAFVFGMVRAFRSSSWPSHFSEDDIQTWSQRGRWAEAILVGGDYSEEEAIAVVALANRELDDGPIDAEDSA